MSPGQRVAALLDRQVPGAGHQFADRRADRVVPGRELTRGRDGEPERREVRGRSGRARHRDGGLDLGRLLVRGGGLADGLTRRRVAVTVLLLRRGGVAGQAALGGLGLAQALVGRVAVLTGLAGGGLEAADRGAGVRGLGDRGLVGQQRSLERGHQRTGRGSTGQHQQGEHAQVGTEAVAVAGGAATAGQRPEAGPERGDGQCDAPLVEPQAEHQATGDGLALEAVQQDQGRGDQAEQVDRGQHREERGGPGALRAGAAGLRGDAVLEGDVRQEGRDEQQDGRTCDGGVSPGESAQIH
ncbi:hypothetical protein [Kitasatospora sp. P5_F3]